MLPLTDKKNVKDVSFKDVRAFVRVDFNVPIDNGVVTGTQRIEATLDTIKYILEQTSHLGRPNGKIVPSLSLKPVADVLEKLLSRPVELLTNYLDTSDQVKVKNATNGKIFLLENLRFHPEEEGSYKDDQDNKVKAKKEDVEKFCNALSSLCDIYVNDAFGTAHRAHSSIVGVNAKEKVCGFLMLKELENFSLVLDTPKKPMMAILGGSKVSDKIPLIKNLIPRVDYCAIVGGMSYTFNKEMYGNNIGNSLYDQKGALEVPFIVEIAKKHNVELIIPIDYIIADKFSNDANIKTCNASDGIADNWMGLDIGKETISKFCDIMSKCSTIIWNGPAGVFEMSNFCHGTNALLKHLSSLTKKGVITIIGGGDTATAALKIKKELNLDLTYISTGGGASLELLEGKELPGITTLSSRTQNHV